MHYSLSLHAQRPCFVACVALNIKATLTNHLLKQPFKSMNIKKYLLSIICAIFACGYWLFGKKLCKPHDSWQCVC